MEKQAFLQAVSSVIFVNYDFPVEESVWSVWWNVSGRERNYFVFLLGYDAGVGEVFSQKKIGVSRV